MGQVLHGCARTTEAVRRAIQNSEESVSALAERYDLNPKTIQKWKKRNYTHDTAMGPKECRSTTLSEPPRVYRRVICSKVTLLLYQCVLSFHSNFSPFRLV